ncbi:Cyclin-dependent kinase inhibitor 1 [Cardamine amara subsp. amara]|uniref:Cyclin-dependent kinase inhibitor 1 n=1 Tax=Cardamine amara subsp. amara TaxID=228776 RepID=A0ABD1BPJ0_CARAN
MVRKCRKAKGMVEAGVSSTYMQLRSRRIVYIRSENTSFGVGNEVSSSKLSSCCASNEFSIDLDQEDKDGDTETSTYRSTKRKLFETNLREEKEESNKSMENCSPEFKSDIKESSDCCCRGRISMEEKTKSTTEMPAEVEIEEFFVEAEKKLNEKFKKKYNFDFEKEKPLEGRYEWVKLE